MLWRTASHVIAQKPPTIALIVRLVSNFRLKCNLVVHVLEQDPVGDTQC